MKRILTLMIAMGAASGAMAQASVSIGINQPGVYGRINIGDIPRPALYRAEPVIIAPPPALVERQPVYVYAPPAHQQNWRRYCGQYDACGHPVYFVREDWVRQRYEQEHPGWNRGRHRGWDKHDRPADNEHGDEDRRDRGRNDKHRD